MSNDEKTTRSHVNGTAFVSPSSKEAIILISKASRTSRYFKYCSFVSNHSRLLASALLLPETGCTMFVASFITTYCFDLMRSIFVGIYIYLSQLTITRPLSLTPFREGMGSLPVRSFASNVYFTSNFYKVKISCSGILMPVGVRFVILQYVLVSPVAAALKGLAQGSTTVTVNGLICTRKLFHYRVYATL